MTSESVGIRFGARISRGQSLLPVSTAPPTPRTGPSPSETWPCPPPARFCRWSHSRRNADGLSAALDTVGHSLLETSFLVFIILLSCLLLVFINLSVLLIMSLLCALPLGSSWPPSPCRVLLAMAPMFWS